jgi:hypothetical protein
VTILCRNVPVVCGASYHLLGYRISQDSKIRFRLQVESYISNWLFSESRLLVSYVSRHKAMVYDSGRARARAVGRWQAMAVAVTPAMTMAAVAMVTVAMMVGVAVEAVGGIGKVGSVSGGSGSGNVEGR